MGSNKSRTFYTQAILPGASVPIPTTSTGQGGNNSEKAKSNNLNNPPPAAKNMVRTDCREQKLEKFLVSKPTSDQGASNNATVGDFANSEKSIISINETLPDDRTTSRNSDVVEVIEPMDTTNNSRSMIYERDLYQFQIFCCFNYLQLVFKNINNKIFMKHKASSFSWSQINDELVR